MEAIFPSSDSTVAQFRSATLQACGMDELAALLREEPAGAGLLLRQALTQASAQALIMSISAMRFSQCLPWRWPTPPPHTGNMRLVAMIDRRKPC